MTTYVLVAQYKVASFSNLEDAIKEAEKDLNPDVALMLVWYPAYDDASNCIVYFGDPKYGKIYATTVK